MTRKQSTAVGVLNLVKLEEFARTRQIKYLGYKENKEKAHRDRNNKEEMLEHKLGLGGSTFEYIMLDCIPMLLIKLDFFIKPEAALTELKNMIVGKRGICDEKYFESWYKLTIESKTAASRWTHKHVLFLNLLFLLSNLPVYRYIQVFKAAKRHA